MSSDSETALAKVNLYLHVTGRRADGYHLLDSLAIFPGAADRITASAARTLSLEITGPHKTGLSAGEDNLVLRAARALSGTAGARLVLEKHLPVAAGLGGGSADAAATLRLLVRLWGLHLEPDVLAALAVGLGADLPVCLGSVASRMGGIGERLEPPPHLPKHSITLVNPGRSVATAEVFRARSGGFSAPPHLPRGWPDAYAMAHDLAALHNDLQPAAITLCPDIADVLAALSAQPGCLLARMSGSGATCFGLFAQAGEANAAAERLQRPGWWCWSDAA